MASWNIGLLLYIPYRTLEERVYGALVAAGYGDLTLAQARIFQRIAAEGSRITDLAEQASITKQTASVLVRALESGGYVERAPDPRDARASLIRVAARGSAAVEVGAAEISRIEEEWRSQLGPARYGRLVRDLEVLRELTDRRGRA